MPKWINYLIKLLISLIGVAILIGGFLVLKYLDFDHSRLMNFDKVSFKEKLTWSLIGLLYLIIVPTGWELLLGKKLAQQWGCLLSVIIFLILMPIVIFAKNWFRFLTGQICLYLVLSFALYALRQIGYFEDQ